MGLVPAAHKALGKGDGDAFPYLLEIDLPSGSLVEFDIPDDTFRCAMGTYNSITEGSYPALITRWESIVRDASDPQGHLSAVEFKVTINDQSGFLSRLKEGEFGDRIRGSAARAYRAHPSLTKADWLPVFTGIVSGMGPLRGYSWDITFRCDDRPLQEDIPAGWTFNRADWQNADPAVLGGVAPWVYGQHSSLGLGDKGMVPCFNVDTVNFVQVISAGYLKSVDAVYKADVLLTLATDYAIAHPVKNGRQFTCVDLVDDPGTDAITADVTGVEETGDGTGALLESREKLLSHILNNLVWDSYQSGAYQYTSAPLHDDGGIFPTAAEWFTTFGITGSRHLFGNDGAANALELLDEFCEDSDMRSFWTALGKLDIKPVDHRFTDLYLDEFWIRQDESDEIGDSFSLSYDDSRIVDYVVMQYLLDTVQGKPLYTLEVGDTNSTEGVTEALTDRWSTSAA